MTSSVTINSANEAIASTVVVGVREDEGLMETDELGESDSDDEAEGLREREDEALGDSEAEIDGEALELGEIEAEAAVKPDVTLPKILSITAPVTVNKVAVPTLPKLTPSSVTDLSA
jgi:hypothetical protein